TPSDDGYVPKKQRIWQLLVEARNRLEVVEKRLDETSHENSYLRDRLNEVEKKLLNNTASGETEGAATSIADAAGGGAMSEPADSEFDRETVYYPVGPCLPLGKTEVFSLSEGHYTLVEPTFNRAIPLHDIAPSNISTYAIELPGAARADTETSEGAPDVVLPLRADNTVEHE
ncbi:unnamed protein product, partial [Prorocentrum cordatum]